ncbi:MAG: LysM peptidoglycan-binding domain-containing protein [Tepidisphaeraceae bacterium]
MLVLRKEIKMGLGIGVAVLGIAAVYGLMATLSSGGSHEQQGTEQVASDTPSDSGPHGLDSAVSGLPPKDDGSAAKPPAVASTPSGSTSGDPFAESNRTDGNKSDPWTLALATGRVTTDSKPASADPGPLVVATPTVPTPPTPVVADATENAAAIAPPTPSYSSTPAEPAKHPAVAKASAPSGKYVVQAGDTFSTIAAKTLGSKRLYMLIAKANPNVDPRRLRIGTELTIPARESVANLNGSMGTATHNTLVRSVDRSRQYEVAPGDTLHRIALKLYGKSSMWESIYDANKQTIGPDAGRLKIGTVLTLPKPATR